MPQINSNRTIELSQSPDFWYQVAFRGKYIHPLTKRPFELSDEKFDSWTEYFSYLKSKGNTIPIVKNHSTDPTDRLGTLTDTRKDSAGYWIRIDWLSDEIKAKVKASSFSVLSSDGITNFEGKQFKHALLHVGVTDYPVLKGLQKILAAEDFFFEEELLKEKLLGLDDNTGVKNPIGSNPSDPANSGQGSKMKNIAIFLGLNPDSNEDTILSEIRKMKDASEKKDIKLADVEAVVKSIGKIKEGILAERRKKLVGLSEADIKKFEPYCTLEASFADFGKENTLFDIALDSIKSKSKGKGNKNRIALNSNDEEDEDDELEESFQTGDQNGDELGESDLVKMLRLESEQQAKRA